MASQTYKILIAAKDTASKSFKGLNKVAGKTGQIVGGLTKGVATATVALTAASVAVAAVARSSFEFADAIGKVSTRTGIATDTVQAFQIAAVESGSSVEIANKSLEKFTRSVGDAQRGLKTQADIFRDLGVSIEDANGNTKTMDVLLREVSDGMAGLKSQSEKATVAANLFGRAGIQIVDVLDNGGAAFDAYIARAEQLGLVLSEDGIRQSEKFNDTLALINRQFKTVTAAISIAFLPMLQTLAGNFSTLTSESVGGAGGVMAFGKMVRETVTNALVGFMHSIADIMDGFIDFRVSLHGLGINLENIGVRFEQAGNSAMFLAHATLGNITQAMHFAAKMGVASTRIKDADAEMENFRKTMDVAPNSVRLAAEKMEKFFTDVFGENVPEEIQTLLETMVTGFDAVGTSVGDISKPFDAFKKTFDEFGEEVSKQNMIVKGFKDAEDALVDFVQTGDLNFKNMVDNFIKELIRLQIRMNIIKPFFEAFTGAGGFGQGGFRAGINKLFGTSFDNGGFTGNGIRAGGIDGKGGFPAILHPNETVIDHTKGQQVAQAQPVSINFSIQATDAAGVDEIIASRKNQIVAMVSQAMNQRGKVGLV
jgi:hypothetical protein